MSSGIASFYPNYSMLDLVPNATITTSATGSGGITTDGTKGNAYDNDFGTSYDTVSNNGSIMEGGQQTVIDFGKIVSNALLSYYIIYTNGTLQTSQYILESSSDGSNWTTIYSSTLNLSSSITKNASQAIPQLRYLRSRFYVSNSTSALTTAFVEVHLAGR